MEESANAFEVVANNIKKQLNINAEREERVKESCEILKQSIDDVFYSKMSSSPVSSSKIKNRELEVFNQALKANSGENTTKRSGDSQKLKDNKQTSNKSENSFKVSNTKLEKHQKENSALLNKEKEAHQLKNTQTSKESVGNCKVKSKVKVKTDTVYKKSTLLDGFKPESSDAAPLATQTNKSIEAKVIKPKCSTGKINAKGSGIVKNFKFKAERKIPITHNVKTSEQKSLSIEKSIEVAVGLEMDNLRNFMLDQNMSIHREISKLEEMAKKQAKENEDLFSVIDELLEENKKLMYKH